MDMNNRLFFNITIGAAASAALAFAQLGGAPPSGGGGSVAAQLPLSGRTGQSGSVTATQTPVPGTNASVNTLNTSISVQGTYAGSANGTTATPFSGKLSLHEAIQRGLSANLSVAGLSAAVKQAEGQARVARAALMPNISGSYRENVLEQDLQVLGLGFPGVPKVVGPLAYFDLRATLSQSVLDMTALNNTKAARENVAAQQQAIQNARDVIVLAVGLFSNKRSKAKIPASPLKSTSTAARSRKPFSGSVWPLSKTISQGRRSTSHG
jgi:hypothetical protein